MRKMSPFERTAMFSSHVGLGNWVIIWVDNGILVLVRVRDEDRDVKKRMERRLLRVKQRFGGWCSAIFALARAVDLTT